MFVFQFYSVKLMHYTCTLVLFPLQRPGSTASLQPSELSRFENHHTANPVTLQAVRCLQPGNKARAENGWRLSSAPDPRNGGGE